MAHDFRTVAEAVKRTVRDMDAKDPNWKWKAVAQKEGKIPPFIITDGSQQEGNTENDFIVLRDERGYFMNGGILGEESWQDGDLEKCVVSLMRGLQSRVNYTY